MFLFPTSLAKNYDMFLCWWQMEMETEMCFRFHHSLKLKQKNISVSSCHLFVINLLSFMVRVPYLGYLGQQRNHKFFGWCFIHACCRGPDLLCNLDMSEIIGDLATYLVPHLCLLFCNGIFWYMRTCILMVLKLQRESFLDSVRI